MTWGKSRVKLNSVIKPKSVNTIQASCSVEYLKRGIMWNPRKQDRYITCHLALSSFRNNQFLSSESDSSPPRSEVLFLWTLHVNIDLSKIFTRKWLVTSSHPRRSFWEQRSLWIWITLHDFAPWIQHGSWMKVPSSSKNEITSQWQEKSKRSLSSRKNFPSASDQACKLWKFISSDHFPFNKVVFRKWPFLRPFLFIFKAKG